MTCVKVEAEEGEVFPYSTIESDDIGTLATEAQHERWLCRSLFDKITFGLLLTELGMQLAYVRRCGREYV
jgi:hypothetical protein